MAGIGFRLQKLLEEDNYTSSLKAYAASAMIAAGPFMMTILVVAGIHWFSFTSLTRHEVDVLQALITYGFAFSLLTIGPSYLVITRHVADSYHKGQLGAFTATYFSALLLNGLVWGPFALWFCSGLSVDWPVKIHAFLLCMFATGIWLALVFLSAAKDFNRITGSFAVGSIVSFGAAALMGKTQGLAGTLGGFALGQGVILLLLSTAVIKEFGYAEPRDHSWLRYFRKYPRLAAIGFFYNLGIWADKLMFWSSSAGEPLDAGLAHCPVYDAPLFFAYLTIIPSLAYFLIRMETNFFEKYHAYYKGIEDQCSLPQLERRRQHIIESLGDNFTRLAVIQGILSGLALLAVPWLTQITRMNPLQMGILRIGIFASFLQVGFLITLNILLYFDFQREALACAASFCAANILLTAVSLQFGLPAFGYGYTLACFLGLMLALVLLNERLSRLHYWTFMRQPLPRPIVVEEEFLS